MSNPYNKMLNGLSAQVGKGQEMLRQMGLYRAFALLRDFQSPLGNSEPQADQRKAMTTAEANGLSIGFWLTKSADDSVEPRTIVTDTARLVEEVINLAPQPREYACRRGCHFCCHEAVTVSEVEAAALARHVEALPEAEKSTVMAKLESYAEGVRRLGVQAMQRNKVFCAFLDSASGACTVYAIRPYMCRALTSYDVTPCKTDDQTYQVDHIRYGAYTGALMGAAHSEMPDHYSIMNLPREQQKIVGENLAVGVLRQLRQGPRS